MAYAGTTIYDFLSVDREALMNILVNISPKKTHLLSTLARIPTWSIKHEWIQDALAAASASNAVADGADVTFVTAMARSRPNNWCQQMQKPIATSWRQQAARPAGVEGNEHEYQIEKAIEEIGRDAEAAFIQSTSASGDASTASKMNGLNAIITTNIVPTATAGRTYTYAIHQALSEMVANAGGEVDLMYFKSSVVNQLAAHPGSAGGTAVRINTAPGTITDYYDTYHDGFGMKKLVPNIGNFAIPTATATAAGSNSGIFLLTTKLLKIAFLLNRQGPIGVEPLAKTGLADKSVVYLDCTLEYGIETAHGKGQQIANS